jgi:hypothetical protein
MGFNANAQDQSRRDGNWWSQIDGAEKNAYMVGFFDGLVLGEKFSYWGKNGMADPSYSDKVKESFDQYYNLMKHTTNDQFTDGINVFYRDYRNRRIEVSDAVWIVLNTIVGKTDKEIQVMTENFRKNAGQ